MILSGTHTVEIWGRKIPDIVAEMFTIYPTPESLDGQTMHVTWEEEAAFDKIFGLGWSAFLCLALVEKYRKLGHKIKGAGCSFNPKNQPKGDSGYVMVFRLTL